MKTVSLARQTIGIVLLAQVFSALVLCGAALLHERNARFHAFDAGLQGSSDSLLGAIQDAEDTNDNVAIDPAELNVPKSDVYAVYNRGGRLLGASANAPAALIARTTDGLRNVRAGGRSYRVLQRDALRVIDRAEFGGVGLRRPVTILYAAPDEHIWHEIFEAAQFYLVTIVAAAVASVFLVAVLLRQALSPLSELSKAAGALSAPVFAFMAPPSVLQVRELRPLADVLTSTAARLRDAFAKEQRFISDAAHELKTAIAVVRSSVQVLMLKRRTLDEYSAGLERILEDNQRVEALVMQMLQLARLEEAPPAQDEKLDLCHAVQCVTANLHPVALEHGVRLHTQSDPALMVKLQQQSAEALIANLVLNAIQHSRPDSLVSVSAMRDATGRVRLEVKDQGDGIGTEALPHIFERFYREDASRSRQTGGTGLGLAICKSIVDQAGATIQVESSQGFGTTMQVTFMPA